MDLFDVNRLGLHYIKYLQNLSRPFKVGMIFNLISLSYFQTKSKLPIIYLKFIDLFSEDKNKDSKEFYDYSLALGDYLASINARIPNNPSELG